MRLYYVEDERDLASVMSKYLIKEGYDVTVFSDGESAIKHVGDPVDMWILDIMLTGDIDGYDLINEIKKSQPDMPIIFTSARDQALDRVRGLELGSDDYLPKPFSPKELVLRVKAILRRAKQIQQIVTYGNYIISLENREIKEGDKTINLTNKEFELLLMFVKNKHQALDRQEILTAIWGSRYDVSVRVVDDLLRRLRNKMPDLRIETIYGFGYRML